MKRDITTVQLKPSDILNLEVGKKLRVIFTWENKEGMIVEEYRDCILKAIMENDTSRTFKLVSSTETHVLTFGHDDPFTEITRCDFFMQGYHEAVMVVTLNDYVNP